MMKLGPKYDMVSIQMWLYIYIWLFCNIITWEPSFWFISYSIFFKGRPKLEKYLQHYKLDQLHKKFHS